MNGGAKPTPSLEEVRALAGAVCDPELPPLTLADLGILRAVDLDVDTVVVALTPTYSGCPAVEYIEDEVRRVLKAAGCGPVRLERVLSPAWTTDWITDEGRQKLADAGIAPPMPMAPIPFGPTSVPVVLQKRTEPTVPCPRCGSTNTTEISAFGSTACKALYRCEACAEPFDYFKEL